MNRMTCTRLRSVAVMALVALCAAASVGDAMAQRGQRGPNLDRSTNFLSTELSLTAEQQERIRPIMQEHFARQQELLDELGGRASGTPLYSTDEMKQLREETHARVEEVLNDQQSERYREIQQNPSLMRGARRPMNRPDRNAVGARGPNVDRAMQYMTAQLDLTDSQRDDIRPLMEDHFARQRELFAEKPRGAGTRLGATEEMAELRAHLHEQVEQVLSREQLERYRELQQNPSFMRGGDRPMRNSRRGNGRR